MGLSAGSKRRRIIASNAGTVFSARVRHR